MKVLIVECINPSRPVMGGGGAYSRNLLDCLSKAGIEVSLLGFGHTDRTLFNNRFSFTPITRKTRLTGYEYFLRLIPKALSMRIPVSTIIHAQLPQYVLPFLFFHRKNPRVVTLHGKILQGIKYKRKKIVGLVYEIVESLALKHTHIIIAVDDSTREFYQQRYPQLAKRIVVIPIGIDLSRFRLLDRKALRYEHGFKPNDRVIAFVGRLEKEKSLDFLIDCFSTLVELVHEAILVIVGDGRERERLEGLVRSLGLKRVIFCGAQAPDKIPEILNCADVLALCSLFEGSPTIVKEALACGVPVVSTDVGDVGQIIKNKITGRVVSRNKENFSNALVDMLMIEDRERVRIECAKVAVNFSFEQICARTTTLYGQLQLHRLPKKGKSCVSKKR